MLFAGVVTVYTGQLVTITGGSAPVGQLALLDASVHVLDGGTLLLDKVHMGGGVTVDSGGVLQSQGGSLVRH